MFKFARICVFIVVASLGLIGPASAVVAGTDSMVVTKIVGNPAIGVEPGDSLEIRPSLRNTAATMSRTGWGRLTTSQPGVHLGNDTTHYPVLEPGAHAWASSVYGVRVDPSHPCGSPVELHESIDRGNDTLLREIRLAGRRKTFDDTSKSTPVPLVDSAVAVLHIDQIGTLETLKVRVGLAQSMVGNLKLTLIAPNGRRVVLADRQGGLGDGFSGTVFDDAAGLSISAGMPPFSGSFKPSEPLSILRSEAVAGDWKLVANQVLPSSAGSLGFFALEFVLEGAACGESPAPLPPPSGLRAVGNPTSISLSWDSIPLPDVWYGIYRSEGDTNFFDWLDAAYGIGYTDATVVPGTRYYYKIASIRDPDMQRGTEIVFATAGLEKPRAPSNFRVVAGSRKAVLRWSPSGAGGILYEVYRMSSGEAQFSRIAGIYDTLFVDSSLANGIQIQYMVRSIDQGIKGGVPSEFSAIQFVTPLPDPILPPVSVQAIASSHKVEVRWSSVASTTGQPLYEVQRQLATEGRYLAIRTTLDTQFVDTPLTNGVAASYRIVARNLETSSIASMVATATPHPDTLLPPGRVFALAGSHQVMLSWAPSVSTEGPVFYELQRKLSGEPDFMMLRHLVDTFFVDGSLVNGIAASYQIVAINAETRSVPSDPVVAVPHPDTLLPPGRMSALAGSHQVMLSWAPSVSTEGSVFYELQRKLSGEPDFTMLRHLVDTFFVDGSLVNGIAASYRIVARNAETSSIASMVATATPRPDTLLPPSRMSALAGSHQVMLSWAPSVSTEGSVFYELQRKLSGEPDFTMLHHLVDTFFVDGSLVNGIAASYRIVAFNAETRSVPSVSVVAVPMPDLPLVPSNFAGIAGDRSVRLSWDAVSGATSYELMRWTAIGDSIGTWLTPDLVSWVDETGLVNGTTYFYAISAANADGKGLRSSSIVVKPLPPLPEAPVELVAIAGDRSISLKWNRVSGAASYTVESSSSAQGPFDIVATGIVDTTFEISRLANGTTYHLVVAASNLAGEGPISASASATPVAPVADLKVLYRSTDADPSDNTIKTEFQISNEGATAVPLSALTIRYWYANEPSQAQVFWCDWARMGIPNVVGTWHSLTNPVVGADGYMEIGFKGAAGNLAANSLSGEILGRITRTDWSNHSEVGDWSYDPSKADFAASSRTTLYRDGILVWGVEPSEPLPPKSTPSLKARYKAGTRDIATGAIRPFIQVVNTTKAAIPLSEITVRYWFTADGADGVGFWCDWAKLGAEHIWGRVRQAVPAKSGADRYLEIGFKPSAGSLVAGASTGEIQSRLSKSDWSAFLQANDASFDASKTDYADWTKATVYRDGVLVWGTEP